jgi:hypothetical protein
MVSDAIHADRPDSFSCWCIQHTTAPQFSVAQQRVTKWLLAVPSTGLPCAGLHLPPETLYLLARVLPRNLLIKGQLC